VKKKIYYFVEIKSLKSKKLKSMDIFYHFFLKTRGWSLSLVFRNRRHDISSRDISSTDISSTMCV